MEELRPSKLTEIMNDFWEKVSGSPGVYLRGINSRSDKMGVSQIVFQYALEDTTSMSGCANLGHDGQFIYGAFFGFIKSNEKYLSKGLFSPKITNLRELKCSISQKEMDIEGSESEIIFSISFEVDF